MHVDRTTRNLAIANLIAQIGIMTTGVTVRVTASGLGCETWPRCNQDSFVPVPGAGPAIHQAIEFGNRLLTFVLVAVASYAVIPLVARRVHMKWMMFAALAIIATGMPFMYLIGKSGADFATRQLMGMLLFGYCGVGQAIIYVMIVPMMGDIIDCDERRSGERREALYNGLSAFIWKASMAGSVLLASLSMSVWGNRVGEHTGVLLVGPFAGLFGLLGMVVIALYPVMKPGAARKEGTP